MRRSFKSIRFSSLSRNQSEHSHGSSALPDITPLIDVVFVVLIFLILAMLSMKEYRGVDVTLPVVENSSDIKEGTGANKAIYVSIKPDGTVYVDKELVGSLAFLLEDKLENIASLSKLFDERFSELMGANVKTQSKIFVSADKLAPFGVVSFVMSQMRTLGASDVVLLVNGENRESGSSGTSSDVSSSTSN